jgi:SAM-dependent methyltransferase
VANLLVEQLELQPGAPVLELGAGTGQLSEALVAAGLELTAVEPLEATRELLAAAIGPERVRAGRAEEIPLPDDSVRAVFAADAFHWFDEQLAMPEIKRVLQPGGGVAILRTAPAIDDPWSRELGEVINEVRPEHPAFNARGAAAALEEDPSFGPVHETKVTSRRELDRDGLIALVASFSWVATLPESDRERMLTRFGAVLDAHQFERKTYDVLHLVWLARLI